MKKHEKSAFMLSMITDWQQSGKSKKQYCLEKGIREATFYYWFARSREQPSTGSFIRVDNVPATAQIEIIYPNGVRLHVQNDPGLIAQLIRLY